MISGTLTSCPLVDDFFDFGFLRRCALPGLLGRRGRVGCCLWLYPPLRVHLFVWITFLCREMEWRS